MKIEDGKFIKSESKSDLLLVIHRCVRGTCRVAGSGVNVNAYQRKIACASNEYKYNLRNLPQKSTMCDYYTLVIQSLC